MGTGSGGLRLAIILMVVGLMLISGAAPALANHYHTIGDYSHGLRYADNFNFYIRPEIRDSGGSMSDARVTLYRTGGAGNPLQFKFASSCSTACPSMIGFDWDTTPDPECYYLARVKVVFPVLTEHDHVHHGGWCG